MSTPEPPNMLSAVELPFRFQPDPTFLFLGQHVKINLLDGAIALNESATKEDAARELWDFVVRFSPLRDLPQFVATCTEMYEHGKDTIYENCERQRTFERFAQQLQSIKSKMRSQ